MKLKKVLLFLGCFAASACATFLATGPKACSSEIEATATSLLANGYQLDAAFPMMGGGVVTAFVNSKLLRVRLVAYTGDANASVLQGNGFTPIADCKAADGSSAHLLSIEVPLPTQR